MDVRNKRKEMIMKKVRSATEPPVPMDLCKEITRLFQLQKRKKRRISEYMCESIRKTKLKAGKTPEPSELYSPLPTRRASASELRTFINETPSTIMSTFQEKAIRKKIHARGLETSHGQLVADMMKETKLEFVTITHYAGMNFKIKSAHPELVFTLEPYKFKGRTERYKQFLKTRKQLEGTWILHYKVVRYIHEECIMILPYQLTTLIFKKTGMLSDLEAIFNDKIERVSQFVYEFYLKIMAIVHREQLKTKQRTDLYVALGACTGLVSLHISRSIAHTLLGIIKITESPQTKPYLILNITFKNGLVLSPTADQVISAYSKFLEEIIEIGKEVNVLERNKIRGYENKYIHLCLTEEFITKCKTDLKSNISRRFEPILNFLANLNSQFEAIYNDIDSKDFFQSISDINFEEGCKRINYYREYLHKVMFIPDHEFFKIGKLFLIEYREKLYSGLNKNIDAIFDKLRSQHFWEVNDLCENFEMIQMRATQEPLTTEELIETGKYMNWVRNEHMMELTERVTAALHSLCQIIDLGMLTEEHIALNSATIHWPGKISPLIDEHAVNFDQLKFEAEEKLQKVVEDVIVLIKNVYPILIILDEMDDIARVRSYLSSIILHMNKIKEIEKVIAWINKEEIALSFPPSTYAEFEELKNYVYPFYHLLKMCLDVQRNLSVWQDGSFDRLNYNNTKEMVDKLHQELTETYKVYRKKLRQAQDENLPLRFRGTVDDPDILNWPAPLKLCGIALRQLEEFKPSVDIMEIICNPCLRKRHWDAMSEIAGINVTPNAGTTLRKMMKIDFQSKLKEYEIISSGATKEKELKDHLLQLQAQWDEIRFVLEGKTDIKFLSGLEEIDQIISDQAIKIMNMKTSIFIKPHENEVTKFNKQILKIQDTIEYWGAAQSTLTKIIPIFQNSGVNSVIPKESALFEKVYQTYITLTNLIAIESVVLKVVSTSDLTEKIKTCLEQLEIVHKGMFIYLEVIREYFPRFYFLSNDELLEALSKPEHVFDSETFLIKIFQGFYKLNADDQEIKGVYNLESEKFNFAKSLERKLIPLEELCSLIECEMKSTLKTKFVDCYKLYKRIEFSDILNKFPTQIIQVITQVYFTESIETALVLPHNVKLRFYLKKVIEYIEDKVSMMKNDHKTNKEKNKLRELLVNDINNKNLLDKIMNGTIPDIYNFDWEASFKYYYQNQIISVKTLSVEEEYQYEYLENAGSFVCTSLTDRSLRALLSTFYSNINSLVRGDFDTGKTETIKYLARAFGILLVVFNCTNNLNINFLKGLLKGNSLCGSWICFENLTSLSLGNLSIISQDLLCILTAKRGKLEQFMINEKSFRVNRTSFVTACIKINNLDITLPRNLKVQFRTLTMIYPDFKVISETTLQSYGFESAQIITKKVCCLFKLSRKILAVSQQYNFGFSKLNEILRISGKLKWDEPESDEESIVYDAIIKVLSSMMAASDKDVFLYILNDIFRNAQMNLKDLDLLSKTIETICQQDNLQSNPDFTKKIIETYHCLAKGNKIILVGDTWSGKTTIIHICKELMTSLQQKNVTNYFINPNYLDYDTLFGNVDTVSQHWSDGLITKLIRNISSADECSNKWLIFDGNMNHSWIENINPILNQQRYYADSGEVLIVPKSLTTIFEVINMSSSSPSVLSRCAVVYVDKEIVGWKSLVKTWAACCTSEWIIGHQEQIFDILCWIISPCLSFISNQCVSTCTLLDSTIVTSTILLAQMILDDVFSSINKKEEDPRNFSVWIQAALVQAGLLGIGSIIDTSSKHKFDEFYKALWKGQNPDHPHPPSLEKLEVSIPLEGYLYDYQYIYRQRGAWKLHNDLLKGEKTIESPYMYQVLIPTADTLKYGQILSLYLKYQHPVLFVGPSGTGKTLLIEDTLINKTDEEKVMFCQINSSIHLSPGLLQNFILSQLNKSKSGKYLLPLNKNFLLFIDNLNLVSSNKYGNIECLELLRQHLDHKVLYDFDTRSEVFISNLNMVASMNSIDGSKQHLHQRFLRHFSVIGVNEFSDDTVLKIYSNTLLNTYRKKSFPGDIVTLSNQLAEATLDIYKHLNRQCKPTLSRPYYIFNLNSISKVIQGCSLLKKETFDANKRIYLKLWVHEIMRVFGDRLNSLDNSWLRGKIRDVFTDHFHESLDETFENENQLTGLMFSTIADKDNINNKKYEEITDIKYVVDVLTECLEKYNYYQTTKLNYIIFAYAVEKLVKINRILSLSPGNVVFLGQSGLGKQTLTKLASFLNNFEMFQPEVTHDFDLKNWNDYFKVVLKEAGTFEKQCVLLISEEQILEEIFLENLDHFMRNGEIPGLYNLDERQEILELTRLAAQGGNKNLDISSTSVFLYFNKRCKENLHLVLSLCPLNDYLHKRLSNFPSLMNCHILFWNDWPDESFQSVGNFLMQNLNFEEGTKQSIVSSSIYFHRYCQNVTKHLKNKFHLDVHIISSSFVHLIHLYSDLSVKKRNDISTKKQKYEKGLSKLAEAATQISNLQKALTEYEPQLAAMTLTVEEMSEQIVLDTIEVEKVSALVRQDEKTASEQATVAQRLKSECESELAQAIPILEDAISALNTLKPSDITLVKSMKNPPDAIKLVMAAVCVIKDVKPDKIPDPSTGRKTLDYWSPSKRILGEMNFLQTLKDFDKDHIKPEIMVKIRKDYLPHKDFKPHVVAKASSAAEGLCKWIIAMDMYDKVAKEVAPKKEKLEKAEKEYAETMIILSQKKEEVARIEEKLAGLNALLDDATNKQLKLQQEVDHCTKKLISAQKLIGSLGGEKVRWTSAVTKLEQQDRMLPGNILLSSAIVAYLAHFYSDFRDDVVKNWHQYVVDNNLNCSDDFSLMKCLSSEDKIEYWLKTGIPNDAFFLENGIILELSKMYSLFIDPEYAAKNWIQTVEKRNYLTLTKFSYEEYSEKLAECITLGKPIMIHEIKENIPPCLNPLFLKQFITENNETYIILNKKKYKVNLDFRLYLISNLKFPKFPPHIFKRLTLINFSITERGLQEKLLKTVSEIEKPELKKVRKELYVKKCTNRKKLLELEAKILRTLCESEMDILEDEASIKVLDETKDLAKITRGKQEETKELEKITREFINKYTVISESSACLYFCVNKLHNLHFIYEYSLEYFTDIYYKAVFVSQKSRILERRCQNIINCFTFQLYFSLSQSLFYSDQFPCLLLITISSLKYKRQITEEELSFFLTQSNDLDSTKANPVSDWLDNGIWIKLCHLEVLETFQGFLDSFVNNQSLWKGVLKSKIVLWQETSNEIQLTNFQKLIVLKILKPGDLYSNIKQFIRVELGETFLQTLHFKLSDCYNESHSLSPILFVLTPSSNILKNIFSLATKKKITYLFRYFSFGKNSDDAKIVSLFEEAKKRGSWLLLENCHLSSRWFKILERKLEETDFDNTHENFRLWLTTEPTENIPLELLQSCLKIVDDNLGGLKSNLTRFYQKEPIADPGFFSSCPGKQELFAKFLFGLCFFHCNLIERRSIKQVSWQTSYSFDEADLNIAIEQLQLTINASGNNFSTNDFNTLFYMFGQCHYGGYMDNKWDIRLLISLLESFLNSEMINKKKFLFNDIQSYGFPKKNDHQDYISLISGLPEEDTFEIYNVDHRTYQTTIDKKIDSVLDSLRSAIFEKDLPSIQNNDFSLLTFIEDLMQKLPSTILKENGHNYIKGKEIEKYNSLLKLIKKTLIRLKNSLCGNIVMSSDYMEMARDILNKKFPNIWKKGTYPHQKNLPQFIEDLVIKVNYFKELQESETTYWLAAFYCPRSLIYNARLRIAKTLNVPLENLMFYFKIAEVDDSCPISLKFVITGLSIFGAKWDVINKQICENINNLYADIPPVVLFITHENEYSEEEFFKCPLYQTSEFRDFVHSVLFPKNNMNQWIKRGVKLICQK